MDRSTAFRYMKEQVNLAPTLGLVLGSGLGELAEEITEPTKIPYKDIPEFPVSTVAGHAGQFVIGTLDGKQVAAMQGRVHFYEGYAMDEVTLPIRLMKEVGIKTLIVTNAAGGVNESYQPGQLMIIKDHMNQMGANPLIGPNDERLGVRFPDMSNAYSATLRALAKEEASRLDIPVQEGVYVGNAGPCYETPAEVRMIRQLGGDAVGMSTVPEVIVARHAGLEVLGISCISNMAAGIEQEALSHEDVIETTNQAKNDFSSLIKAVAAKI